MKKTEINHKALFVCGIVFDCQRKDTKNTGLFSRPQSLMSVLDNLQLEVNILQNLLMYVNM